jgi:TPR repeat protein
MRMLPYLTRWLPVACLSALLAPPLADACEALLGEEYTDPPELFETKLDPSWHTVLRGRGPAYARKEFVPADETLQAWTQLVTWNVSFGKREWDLKLMMDSFVQAMALRCEGLTSRVIRQSEREIVYEWSDKGCVDRGPQQEIVRMRAGVTGYHTLTYSSRGEPRAKAEHERWLAWISDARFTMRGSPSGKADALDDARIAVWGQEYKRALDLLEPRAKAGDPGAQDLLAGLYVEGWGVAPDKRKAFEWLEKAAQKKDAGARYNLARMYDKGWGVAEDRAAALRWYRASAELGDTHAQGRVGYMLANGEGAAKDYAEAARWFQKAAAGGHPHAVYWLGRLHEEGWGFPVDLAKAVPLYQQAAEAGEPDAQLKMGMLHADGRGVALDAKRAKMWLLRAAMQGSTPAREFYQSRYGQERAS